MRSYETTLFRAKCIFGNGLDNRRLDHQKTEANCRIVALKMTFLGMPQPTPVVSCV